MPTRTPARKPIRKPTQRRKRPQVAHLHVVIDPAMLREIEAHAAHLDPRTTNLSAAVRALLRVGLDATAAAA